MMAYIPRWRGEADIVAGKVCRQQACVCLFFRVMAATQAPIWKDHEQEDDFAPNPHTACLEIDYIFSLALLCVLYTSPKLNDQMLPLGEVLNSNDVGVMITSTNYYKEQVMRHQSSEIVSNMCPKCRTMGTPSSHLPTLTFSGDITR